MIWGKKMDFNILIRSYYYKKDRYLYGSGGGITFLSEPDSEWEEMIDKTDKIRIHFGE